MAGLNFSYKPDAVSSPNITPEEAKEIVLTRIAANARGIYIGRYWAMVENIDISEKEMHITYLTQGAWVRKRRELTCRLENVIPEVWAWGSYYYVRLGLGCGDMEIRVGKNEKAATNLADAFYVLKEAAKKK